MVLNKKILILMSLDILPINNHDYGSRDVIYYSKFYPLHGGFKTITLYKLALLNTVLKTRVMKFTFLHKCLFGF